MLKRKDKYGLHHHVCSLLRYVKQIKLIVGPLDNNDDVVHGNSRLPEEKLLCSELYTEFLKYDALKMALRERLHRLYHPLHWANTGPYNEKTLCLLSTLIHLFRTLSIFSKKVFVGHIQLVFTFRRFRIQ